MKSHVRALAGASCAVLALTVAGCGAGSNDAPTTRDAAGDATATPLAQVTGTPAAGAEVVEITLDGSTVSPDGEARTVKRNQPVVLKITAAQAGQLHVHSTPEQVVDFPAGESEITLDFAIPGVVAVEDHALDKTIVQFEVN
ncbi:MAG: hypothetical protein EOO67_20700 [Microbacterium sp.]|nr:MAG: hypothetical protein EOO67_20700 [Microbacterium sp.]